MVSLGQNDLKNDVPKQYLSQRAGMWGQIDGNNRDITDKVSNNNNGSNTMGYILSCML